MQKSGCLLCKSDNPLYKNIPSEKICFYYDKILKKRLDNILVILSNNIINTILVNDI